MRRREGAGNAQGANLKVLSGPDLLQCRHTACFCNPLVLAANPNSCLVWSTRSKLSSIIPPKGREPTLFCGGYLCGLQFSNPNCVFNSDWLYPLTGSQFIHPSVHACPSVHLRTSDRRFGSPTASTAPPERHGGSSSFVVGSNPVNWTPDTRHPPDQAMRRHRRQQLTIGCLLLVLICAQHLVGVVAGKLSSL